MSGRERLLADLEAQSKSAASKDIEVLAADLSLAPEDTSYNPYDKPGHAKPLRPDKGIRARRLALKNRKR